MIRNSKSKQSLKNCQNRKEYWNKLFARDSLFQILFMNQNEIINSIDALMTNQKNIILDCMKSISRNSIEVSQTPQEPTDSLQMLTSDEVAVLFNVHKNQVNMYRDMGILKGIKTGKNYMYSKHEIMEFQNKFKGYDISNKYRVQETLQEMKMEESDEIKKNVF